MWELNEINNFFNHSTLEKYLTDNIVNIRNICEIFRFWYDTYHNYSQNLLLKLDPKIYTNTLLQILWKKLWCIDLLSQMWNEFIYTGIFVYCWLKILTVFLSQVILMIWMMRCPSPPRRWSPLWPLPAPWGLTPSPPSALWTMCFPAVNPQGPSVRILSQGIVSTHVPKLVHSHRSSWRVEMSKVLFINGKWS